MILTTYSVKLRVTVFVLITVLAVVGPLIYLTIPREGAPDITIPYVFITAVYEGVAPEEIENLITVPLERELANLENVKELSSTSAEGVSLVAIEFNPKENIDNAVQKVKDKIDLARPNLPRDLDQPTVRGLNFSTDIPVLTFAVSGDPDIQRLKRLAEDLKDAAETVPGVLQVKIYGAPEREIRVEVDLQRLAAYSIALPELMAAIQAENATISAGNIEIAGDKFQVRVPGEFTRTPDLDHIVVKMHDGKPVRLSDLARITDTYKELASISRINGEPCVTLALHKRAGENADRLIRRVKQVLSNYPLPSGLRLTFVEDQSDMIRMMIRDLENNIASGFILVVAVILVFMGLRNSTIVALAIPLSLMVGFVILALRGSTLNMIVLFSLVLSVGMLVDNAIVIVENIYRHHLDGASRTDAAIRGAGEVAWPVLTSTLTTVAAFIPLMYWPGIMGQFMSFLPQTVIVVLLASLFVALVINPAICSVFISRNAAKRGTGRYWEQTLGGYEKLLRGALRNRGLWLVIGIMMMILTVVTFQRYNRGIELFPNTQPRQCIVQVRYPEGTDIQTTDATLAAIEKGLGRHGDVRFYLTNVGSSGDWALSAAGGTHLGSIWVEFVPFAERQSNTLELVETIRKDIGAFPGAQIKVERERMGPPTGAPVSIEVAGDDFSVLSELADEIIWALRDVPGLVDLQKDLEEARPEIQFRVDRERAARLGLNTSTIGRFLRAAINGETVSKFRGGETEYDITVRLLPEQRQSVDLLKEASLRNSAGHLVPLPALGSFVYEGGRGQIIRKDQKRVVTITGFDQGRGVDEILADVRKRLARLHLPAGCSVSFTGDTEAMNEAREFLSNAFLVALALIALILVMEFNSVIQPFLILLSVILSMIGVMWGLLLCGMRFGVIMTGIGIVSLAGVVVNNGIVLIACINQLRAEGLPLNEAIIAGGRRRLRPVLLTAVSTILGLVPMAVGWSLEVHAWPPRIVAATETSAWWAPMAVAVIFGLAVATMLTLVQVPIMYSLAQALSIRFRRWFSATMSERPQDEPVSD